MPDCYGIDTVKPQKHLITWKASKRLSALFDDDVFYFFAAIVVAVVSSVIFMALKFFEESHSFQ